MADLSFLTQMYNKKESPEDSLLQASQPWG